MSENQNEKRVRLDLYNEVFQENLLTIQPDHDSTYGKK